MSSKPSEIQSLGEEPLAPKFRIIGEERPLPKTRKELVSTFEAILSLGRVQKVVIDISKPIKFFRAVTDDLGEIPEDISENEEFANVRNAEIREFNAKGKDYDLHEHLFLAFQFLTQERLKPKSFLFNSTSNIKVCLGMEAQASLTEIYGIDCVRVDEVPAESLLLSATRHGEEEIILTLRILLPAKKAK